MSAAASSSESAFVFASSGRICRALGIEEPVEADLELLDARRRDVVELAGRGCVQDRDLLLHRERLVLRLLDDLGQLLAAGQLVARRLVQVGRELGKCREGAVLGEIQLERAGDLLHGLGLGRRADARHRDADVQRGPLAGVEQVRLEEDLAVRDRDHVRRDVGGHVAGLRLDDRQRGERAAAVLVVEARGALQQAGVEVEDVARVRLAARRAAQQQRHLAVRPGVLAEVVVDAQRVLHEDAVDLDADLHDLLAEGSAGVRRQVLERRGILGAGDDDDRVPHRAVLLQRRDGLGDGRELLADGDVDADEPLALLVDDRVDGDRGLARLAVADDQLALATADRDQGIDGLDARLDRACRRPCGR